MYLFLLAVCGFFPDPLRFKRFPLTPGFHSKRKDKAIHSCSGRPMREVTNTYLKMSRQPQTQHRIQTNISLFHFTTLAKQSGHCNLQFLFRIPAPLRSIRQEIIVSIDDKWWCGRVTQAGRSSVVVGMYKPLRHLFAWIFENKLPLGVGCSGRIAWLMKWNETRTYWFGFGVGFVAAWTF